MQVRRVDSSDENELAEWTAVHASDEDLWPGLIGFTLPDIRAFARHRNGRSLRPPGGASETAARYSGWR